MNICLSNKIPEHSESMFQKIHFKQSPVYLITAKLQ